MRGEASAAPGLSQRPRLPAISVVNAATAPLRSPELQMGHPTLHGRGRMGVQLIVTPAAHPAIVTPACSSRPQPLDGAGQAQVTGCCCLCQRPLQTKSPK